MNRALAIVFLGALWTAACGAESKGDEGTESHWLSSCGVDADCRVGSCLCGVCTVTCETVSECPRPLDVCLEPGIAPTGGECTSAIEPGLCGVHDSETLSSVLPLRESVVRSCDGGRASSLTLAVNSVGASRATSAGDGEFFLFAGGSQGAGVTRVNEDGHVLQELPIPSELAPQLDDVLTLPTGEIALSGTVETPAGRRAWVGVVDASWNLRWEETLGEDAIKQMDLALLDDGTLVGAGHAYGVSYRESGESRDAGPTEAPRQDVVISAFSIDGETKWSHSIEVEGFEEASWSQRFLVAADGLASVIAPSEQGMRLLRVNADGELSQQTLETTLALHPTGVTALPEGRLAIASARAPGAVISVIDADGAVLWEESYDRAEGAAPSGIAYDQVRSQLILAGEYRGEDGGETRTWMIGTGLDGQREWSLVRKPQRASGDAEVDSITPDRGPNLHSVYVDERGTIVAPGATTFQLTFFILGQGECED